MWGFKVASKAGQFKGVEFAQKKGWGQELMSSEVGSRIVFRSYLKLYDGVIRPWKEACVGWEMDGDDFKMMEQYD